MLVRLHKICHVPTPPERAESILVKATSAQDMIISLNLSARRIPHICENKAYAHTHHWERAKQDD